MSIFRKYHRPILVQDVGFLYSDFQIISQSKEALQIIVSCENHY